MSFPFSYCIVKRSTLAFRSHDDTARNTNQFTDRLSQAKLYDSPEDAFLALWALYDPNKELTVISIGITYEEIKPIFKAVISD